MKGSAWLWVAAVVVAVVVFIWWRPSTGEQVAGPALGRGKPPKPGQITLPDGSKVWY